jgi:ABC-type branched-subunit amino acid transport system substrate-binding protein
MMKTDFCKTVFALLAVLTVVGVVHPAFAANAGGKGYSPAKTVAANAIGCILPLTGRDAATGNRALDAIILASGLFDPIVKTPVRLIIEDSRSEPEGAAAAVTKLVRDAGVLCIIGPLGADESLAAAREAQRFKVPMITLTDQEEITKIGNYVFRFCMTGRFEVASLVNYAMQELGMKRFAVLYPNDNYGNEMETLFREEVLRRKGAIARATPYDTDETDFADEIKTITNIVDASAGGGKGEGQRGGDRVDAGLDALFIPDVPVRLKMIIPQLAFHNVRDVRLLGTSAWNNPDVLRAGGEFLEGAVFVDAFSPNSFYPDVNDFTDVYYANYSREPGTLEALAYDATAMVVKIVEEDGGIKTRDRMRENIGNVSDYRGVTGKTSFSEGRDAAKEVFFLTVKNGQIVQIG